MYAYRGGLPRCRPRMVSCCQLIGPARRCRPTRLVFREEKKPAQLSGLNPYRWTWRRRDQYKPLAFNCKPDVELATIRLPQSYLAPGARLARLLMGDATMKATAFLEQAKREAQLVDALLVARYGLVIHNGMTLLGDDEPPARWRVSFKAELQRIYAALQMAGIDTQQPLHPPMVDRGDGDGDHERDGEGVSPDAGDERHGKVERFACDARTRARHYARRNASAHRASIGDAGRTSSRQRGMVLRDQVQVDTSPCVAVQRLVLQGCVKRPLLLKFLSCCLSTMRFDASCRPGADFRVCAETTAASHTQRSSMRATNSCAPHMMRAADTSRQTARF
ncbi:hypothetical protein AWB70_04177 [Caballeronia cordobensis]|uniref:Uncharacterized protein n=1 Tax=Caballeronia cordobensis TaxID=1353886 RepID=A0A158I5G3_CABCO|nr:hypothetical protein AWB70_04177 [Caballeronia cordobensis]